MFSHLCNAKDNCICHLQDNTIQHGFTPCSLNTSFNVSAVLHDLNLKSPTMVHPFMTIGLFALTSISCACKRKGPVGHQTYTASHAITNVYVSITCKCDK